jgi:hypothetical protein
LNHPQWFAEPNLEGSTMFKNHHTLFSQLPRRSAIGLLLASLATGWALQTPGTARADTTVRIGIIGGEDEDV